LKYDCGEKADLYAKHGIPDYWVVDIKGRRVLVHRDPKADTTRPRGASYQRVTIVDDKGSIEPLAKPGASVRVADLLPIR
jgi:Uma2 family endonuclease